MEVGYITPSITLEREDEAKALLNQLVRGPKPLDVVTIVGMPGLGKTTFATKLYSHEAVKERYDARSWCCVSQTYDRKSVLMEIMRGLDKENSTTEESVLADAIRRFLKGKRYLVVVDDLWSTDAWDDLRLIFPDDNNGSRLVLTTRLDEVASYASTNPHHLRHLTNEESYELLKKIVFGEESCPCELEEVGNEIARSCAGLPIAVVLSAGLLARGVKEVDYWNEVSQNLSSTLFHDVDWLMDVVELSYKTLPHDLKPCFLYFGSFSEDEQISVQKLIQLWICEGLLPQNNDLESLDHVATNYLMDLIGRNLVMVAKRTRLGKAKYVLIHDLLHQFCMKKAEEIHLLQFYRYHDHPQLGTTLLGHVFCFFHVLGIIYLFHRCCCVLCSSETTMPSRLVVSSFNDDFMKWSSPYESKCSLRFNVSVDASRFPSLTGSLEAFKSLTVLDLGKVDVGESFPHETILLIHLRYLQISSSCYYRGLPFPSTISSLVNLETLITDIDVIFPNTIWDLVKLRHLQVPRAYLPECGFYPPEVSRLKKLDTFTMVNISIPRDMPVLVHALSNVVNLGCYIFEDRSNVDDFDCNKPYDLDDCRFTLFQSLHRVESLYLQYSWLFPPVGQVFDFPSTLKFLKLEYFPFCEPLRSLSSIGELPNLELLNIKECRFEGKWDVKDNAFPKLKVLKVYRPSNLIVWNISEDAFPSLQELLLDYCEDVEIPSSFGYLGSLKLVKLRVCLRYTVESAMKIKEIQIDEMANSDFNLIVES